MFREAALNVLQKQYTFTNISDLMLRKAEVLDKSFSDLSNAFVTEILDFDTCIPEALDYYWGKVFKISRTFKDSNGNDFSLTDKQFRQLIKIRAFSTRWDGSILSMNEFLQEIYKDRGSVFLFDRQNMLAQVYVFTFELEPWEKYLFTNNDIFPRPAAIKTEIYELPEQKLFGFYGTRFEPFGKGVFWTGKILPQQKNRRKK